MKSMLISLLLFLVCKTTFAQVYTNGAFSVLDGTANYQLVGGGKGNLIHKFEKGKTYSVGKEQYDIISTNNDTTLLFCNGLATKLSTNSELIINSFGQEIENLDDIPRKARFANQVLTLSLMSGESLFVYDISDVSSTNASCVVSTPFMDVELSKGKFYFNVTEKSVVVFVLEGGAKAYGERKKQVITTTGYAIVSYINEVGILEAKYSLESQKTKPEKVKEFLARTKALDIVNDTIFVNVDGKLLGVSLK